MTASLNCFFQNFGDLGDTCSIGDILADRPSCFVVRKKGDKGVRNGFSPPSLHPKLNHLSKGGVSEFEASVPL